MKFSFIRFTSICLLSVIANGLMAQKPEALNPSEIHHAIEKLNFLGTALYVAAHPDDENTRLIAYLDNEVMARTAYLSLTRGDGGQNLIGAEIRELLGVIRTQELMMARSVDGGEQIFSRANDFGYSKHPDETLQIWEDEEVLSDVVRAIRKFKPDIIINRFDANSAGQTHGHHTASAMLSLEAFDKSADTESFPDQLNELQAWQASRIFFNTSWWFYGSQEAFEKADKSKMVSVDVGVYYPWDGRSNTEIAAESRSMHKCQGFGSTGTRGEQKEYLELLKGDMPSNNEDMFDGINTTWSRLEGGTAIDAILSSVEKNFDFTNPAASIPQLVKARKLIKTLKDEYWKEFKLAEIDRIILACAGAFIEVVTAEQFVSPGQDLKVQVEITNRSSAPMRTKAIRFLPSIKDSSLNSSISENQVLEFSATLSLPKTLKYTGPYWLRDPGTLGMYKVKEKDLIGLPVSPPQLKAMIEIFIDDELFVVERLIKNKFNDPEDGAVYRPLEVLPPATIAIAEKVQIFTDNLPKTVHVQVRSGVKGKSGALKLNLPAAWSCTPQSINVNLENPGEIQSYSFEVTSPKASAEVSISAELKIDGTIYSDELITIDYDHIPFQSVLMPSQAKFVKLELSCSVDKVGYIDGAGDEIPFCLEQIGCEVVEIDLASSDLSKLLEFPTIVMGVRAYNKIEELAYRHKLLMEYVENGGTLVVQYNTNRGLKSDALGPYPFDLSRDRVTMEDAEVRILEPSHPSMTMPNKISSADFDSWVQERGLYFPSKWDENYTSILSSNDKGEDPLDGGLLVAQYGKGWYVYSGYSWFRELPAGVPGAYRIFANLISLGHHGK